jgi:major membrane immunogen (membrane-anchored lipoprotein)
MKKTAVIVMVIFAFLMGACGQKPYYKTKAGKKKQKYYNDIQYGGKRASEMQKP